MQVAILKLTSGEELISMVAEQDGATVLINPCRITTVDTGAGQLKSSFTPIAVYCVDNAIIVQPGQITYTAEPEEGFRDAYTRQFTPKEESNLIVPDGKILLA